MFVLFIQRKNCMATSESKGRFFFKTNPFESRIGMLYLRQTKINLRLARAMASTRHVHLYAAARCLVTG